MKQRFLTLLLAALLMPIGAWAALAVGDKFVVNGMTFQVTNLSPNEVQVGKDLELAIDINTEGAVSIPSSVKDSDGNSYSVTAIGRRAFYACTKLTEISIPSGITKFGNSTFEQCTGLEKVICGSNLSNNRIFYGCKNLKSVELLEGVTSISTQALHYCKIENLHIPVTMSTIEEQSIAGAAGPDITNLHIKDIAAWCKIEFIYNPLKNAKLFMDGKEINDLVIPEGVTQICDKAFYNCISITSVTFPNSLEKIGSLAFLACKNLTSVTILGSVTSIGTNAFNGCSNLTAVHINDVAAWCKIDFASYSSNPLSLAKHLFIDGGEIKDLVIPEGTSAINNYAFYGCEGLNSVSIPKSLKNIGLSAFKDCTNLTAVHINDVAAWCAMTFNSNSFLDNPLQIAGHLFINGQEVKDLIVPEGVTNINKWVFYGCKDFNSVSFPKSLISIGEYAFSMVNALYITDLAAWCRVNCNGYGGSISCKHFFLNEKEITDLVIPDGITSISPFLFSSFDGLTSVNTGNTLEMIGIFAFSSCDNLVSVTLGSSVVSIGAYAFYGCKEIQSVYSYIEKPFDIGNYVFYYKDEATQEDVPLQSATLYVPIGTKAKYEATEGWNNFKEIVEMSILDPIDGETTVNTEGLGGQDLTDNVVDDVYYNLDGNNSGYDSTDGSIVIGETTNMGQITNPMPGTSDVANNFTGLILRVATGKGTITVNVKTIGNAQLVVQVGNGTPMIATKTEQGDVVINYDVAEDTYIYIYAIIGSSGAPSLRAASDNVVKIYGIKVTPGSTGINTVCSSEPIVNGYYTLDGRKIEGVPAKKGIYIVNGRKVVIK